MSVCKSRKPVNDLARPAKLGGAIASKVPKHWKGRKEQFERQVLFSIGPALRLPQLTAKQIAQKIRAGEKLLVVMPSV